jgi:PKD repeat protein
MKRNRGIRDAWLVVLVAVMVAPGARAVLFEATGNPAYNTNAPSGSLANSGWQYEGQWGSYLGTPIASNFFLAAQHIGGSSCAPFILNGVTYTTVRNFDDPDTDLRLWQIAESFPTNLIAPLYAGSSEVGKTCVVVGRGTQRGSLISVEAGRTNGWGWGASDEVERWGENQIGGVYTNGSDSDLLLYASFVLNPTASEGGTNECDLSVGDSSGGMFIQNATTWELAGIHYAVDGPFSTNCSSADDFDAAIADLRGLCYEACDNDCWTLEPTNPVPNQAVPTQFYSTRVSTRISWINSIITNAPPPFSVSFTATPTNGPAPLTVAFTDTSCGSITGWAWAFGDGNTSTNQNPSNIYTNPGTYTVQEIVSGPGGSSTNTLTNLISVYDPFAWWQLSYFDTTNNNTDAAPGDDVYGSGMSNTNKFLAGFNPTNGAAYLHIISIVPSGANVVVTYLGASGDTNYVPGVQSRTNVLDFTTGGASGNYTNVGWQDTGQTNILGVGQTHDGSGGTGLGTVTNMTDVGGATNIPSRYYRVRVLLP